jgi:hypothetical protein
MTIVADCASIIMDAVLCQRFRPSACMCIQILCYVRHIHSHISSYVRLYVQPDKTLKNLLLLLVCPVCRLYLTFRVFLIK